MDRHDEPMFKDIGKDKKTKTPNSKYLNNTVDSIKSLCESQSFAVLSTQSTDQPYSNLIGFATTDDLSHMVFATTEHTRKFHFIGHNKKVSILIDNRSSQADNINRISYLTAIGEVKFLTNKEDIDQWSKFYLKKHPYLINFINSSSTKIALVDVSKYLYVRRFQEVIEWIPRKT